MNTKIARTWRVPTDLAKSINDVALHERIPASELVTWWLYEGLARLRAGETIPKRDRKLMYHVAIVLGTQADREV